MSSVNVPRTEFHYKQDLREVLRKSYELWLRLTIKGDIIPNATLFFAE